MDQGMQMGLIGKSTAAGIQAGNEFGNEKGQG